MGHERTSITQNSCTFFLSKAIAALSLVFSAQPAFAHEAPVIAPTRLDFDASRAPKNCNDIASFTSILGAWVPDTTFRDDAERRLIVRIRWSSTGGKQAAVSLVDGQGTIVAERHATYGAKAECYKVLWAIARDAAKILGAFDPPPPKEPTASPAIPPSVPCPHCPPAQPCPTHLPSRLSAPKVALPPMLHSFLGFGGFVGTGISSKLSGGPIFLLGFVPSSRLSQVHIELEGAWTSQTTTSTRIHSVPLVGSLCWVNGIVRFCGGFATTILFLNQSSPNDPLKLMFGGNFRIGTELFNRGPFSIRADVFGRLAFAERSFGPATIAFGETTQFTAGLALLGAWSFD